MCSNVFFFHTKPLLANSDLVLVCLLLCSAPLCCSICSLHMKGNSWAGWQRAAQRRQRCRGELSTAGRDFYLCVSVYTCTYVFVQVHLCTCVTMCQFVPHVPIYNVDAFEYRYKNRSVYWQCFSSKVNINCVVKTFGLDSLPYRWTHI